ncbi:MAG: L,D-transpeptidase family protein [Ancrocorticia sp.]
MTSSQDDHKPRENQKRRWKKPAAVGGVVVALVVGATGYFGVAHAQALPGVLVGEKSVSGMDEAEIASYVAEKAEQLEVTLEVDGKETVATLADLGISVDAKATAHEAVGLDRPIFTRLATVVNPEDIAPVYSLDEEIFADFQEKLAKPAVNATVKYSEEAAGFVTTASSPGTAVDADQLKASATEAVEKLASASVELETHEALPAVSEKDAKAAVGAANALLGQEVRLTDGVSEYYAEIADKAQWVQVPATEKGLGKPALDKAKVTTWVQKIADETAEPVVNGVHNVSPSGEVLAEAKPGKSGYVADNVEAVVAKLVSTLESGKPYDGEFEYDEIKPKYDTRKALPGYEKFAYPAAEGEHWIDVNLTTYKMQPYIGQTPAREAASIVHGKPSSPTITGTFHVYLQYRTQDMGCSARFTYCAKDVPWVSYFEGDFALHGAPWQPFFGPGAPGSAGCVNLPAEAAEWVYNWVEIGTPVVVHY